MTKTPPPIPPTNTHPPIYTHTAAYNKTLSQCRVSVMPWIWSLSYNSMPSRLSCLLHHSDLKYKTFDYQFVYHHLLYFSSLLVLRKMHSLWHETGSPEDPPMVENALTVIKHWNRRLHPKTLQKHLHVTIYNQRLRALKKLWSEL